MINKSKKFLTLPLGLALAMAVIPSASFSAGANTTSSLSTSIISETSRYSKQSKGRFSEAKSLIAQKKFHESYLFLLTLPIKSKDEADRQNLLGFSARKSGQLEKAANHYKSALKIDPNHKGALEYQGELFLVVGQKSKAENNLKLLKAECPVGCLELTQLEASINKF
tara:strand:+ start:478 stop:981 length:504 start_codon:yes stop_codon:yes gene_type:complete